MLREIVEEMDEGKSITITKNDWDGKHNVFNPNDDIFIGWSDYKDEGSFGAEVGGGDDMIEGNYRKVASFLKKNGIIFDKKVYDYGVKMMKF